MSAFVAKRSITNFTKAGKQLFNWDASNTFATVAFRYNIIHSLSLSVLTAIFQVNLG